MRVETGRELRVRVEGSSEGGDGEGGESGVEGSSEGGDGEGAESGDWRESNERGGR